MPWTIRPVSMLASCAEEWQVINRAATDTPLLDFRFVRDAVSEFANGSEALVTYYDNAMPRAMAILRRATPFSWQTLQPANAPLGFWVGERSCNVEDLLRRLAIALPPQSGMISITQQDPLISPRPAASPHLSTLDYIASASITFPNSFAEYMEGRSKNFRHNISRQRNRLKRENIRARLELVTTAAEMPKAVRDFSELEIASWKGEINSAVKTDEPQGRFYVKLLQSFAEFGEALVYRYYFNERLVASDLCLRRNGTLIILKTACDETLQGLSPAHLMRMDAFAELLDNHSIRRVEFYGPVWDWHTRLTDDVRQMYHINYYRWRIARMLHDLHTAPHRRAPAKTSPSGPKSVSQPA